MRTNINLSPNLLELIAKSIGTYRQIYWNLSPNLLELIAKSIGTYRQIYLG